MGKYNLLTTMHMAQPSLIQDFRLGKLRRAGTTKRMTNNSQHLKIIAIAPIERGKECPIPFAQSLISAGFPSSAENFVENTLDLNDLLIKHASSTFFVRVIGDSMIDAGIKSNDILIVDRALTPAHDKIAVIRINDEFTVKRLKYIGNKTFLVAENPHYKPLQITPEMDVEVWGIVTSIIHQV